MRRFPVILSIVVVISLVACLDRDDSIYSDSDRVSYNYDIRPLISDRCFSCHGPDEKARKADLRLDTGEEIFKIINGDGEHILVRGKPSKSDLWKRISTDDPELLMPPLESHLSLNDTEKELVRKWIQEGAEIEAHWAFQPVKNTLPHDVSKEGLESIDLFVKDKLRKHGLDFNIPADPHILLRRIFFDLTGIGPTAEQVRSYDRDRRENALEVLVDSLFTTTAYAERMTVDWLDVARYADSQGMHSDGWRSMYPWRDWVIRAFKKNMPYDQFVMEQLAGDLMPNPSQDQLIATGFNRNHETTAEGGVVDEEFRKEYAHDRVKTTGTAFLGLTMECARCHDHKYDPISQKEYYQFFGFFNQVDEVGLTGDDGNSGPNLLIPGYQDQQAIDSISDLILEIESMIATNHTKAVSQVVREDPLKTVMQGREIYLACDKIQNNLLDGQQNAQVSGGAEIVKTSRGRVVHFNEEYEYITVKDVGLFDQYQPFSAALWVNVEEKRASQTMIGNSGQKGVFWRGWDFRLDSLNRPMLRLINALPHDAMIVRLDTSIGTGIWTHLAFTYDGSGLASGCRIFVNGTEAPLIIVRDKLQRTIYPMSFDKQPSRTPLRIGKSYRAFTGEYGIYQGMMDNISVYNRKLSTLEVLALSEKLEPEAMHHSDLQNELYQNLHPDPLQNQLQVLRKERMVLYNRAEEVMIMQDQLQPDPTFVLLRGNYNQRGENVTPATPKVVFPFSDTLSKNRLGLAQWIVSPDNPLTARVYVNRIWQQFFGRGIVTTAHDFGVQGSLPTHPELLDFLAFEFVQEGWDIRALIKKIILSKTYQQSSTVSKDKWSKDPENRWLSRGPSFRLTAEMVRDQALSASYLLDTTSGGPSVKPWQPEGLWKEKTSSTHLLRAYVPDTGTQRYRRSLYTFVRRTSMHPMMEIFDAPTRSVCTVKRQSTESPQQALVLLNDPEFVEACRTLADHLLSNSKDPVQRIKLAYVRLCNKEIDQFKLDKLLQFYREEKERFRGDQSGAEAYVSVGQYAPVSDDVVDLAATTLMVNTIINLDDFYFKR
ncbi:MAG: DUF1553 domain-containing protein [Saprospiraceae bacterium]|nr:DUF1553 domain-containing protein [Saprospiraceae bacterium]